MPSLPKASLLLLLAAISWLLFHHFWAYQGHFGIDDMHYAKLGKQWADGSFDISADHYTFRWGIIFSTGLAYWLFGISDHSSALPALAACGFILLLLLVLLRDKPFIFKLYAFVFCLASNWFLFYSDKLMPDMLVAASVLAALASLYHYYFNGSPAWRAALLLSLSCWLGYCCKETIFLLIPWLAFFALRDVFRRLHLRFWLLFAGFSFLFLLLYSAYCYAKTGDPLFRFYAIRLNSYFSECSYDQLPIDQLLRRIGYQLFHLFLHNGFFIALPYAFLPLATPQNTRRYWLFSFLILLASCNFMSASPTAYTPLCLDVRHYLFLLPVAALAAAPLAVEVFEAKAARKTLFLLSFFSLVLMLWAWFSGAAWAVCLVFAVSAVSGWLFLRANLLAKAIILFINIIILTIQPIQTMLYSRSINYFAQKNIIKTHIKNIKTKKTLVISDWVQSNFGAYYLDFDTTFVQFKRFEEVRPEQVQQAAQIYVLLNGYTRYLSQLDWNEMPIYAKEIDKSSAVLLATEQDVLLYKIPASALAH